MKKVFFTFLIPFICLAASAQSGDAVPQQRIFAIHDGKRELKHEYKGKHHDFRKNLHHRHSGGQKHHHKPKHRQGK